MGRAKIKGNDEGCMLLTPTGAGGGEHLAGWKKASDWSCTGGEQACVMDTGQVRQQMLDGAGGWDSGRHSEWKDGGGVVLVVVTAGPVLAMRAGVFAPVAQDWKPPPRGVE